MSSEGTALFRVLSEVNRRRILSALYKREFSVQDLQDILLIGQSTISAHLAQLKLSNLVSSRRNGRFILYRIATGISDTTDTFVSAVIEFSKNESWYQKDERRIVLSLKKKNEASLSFYEGVAMQNKRSPGQTDFALAIGLMRAIRGKRIVDIGCGIGNLVREFSYLNDSVVGIDIEKKQIDVARKIRRNKKAQGSLSFLVASGENTQQADKSADIVIFAHSLHHIEHPHRAIAEGYRILDDNGILIIIDLQKHEELWVRDIYRDVHMGFAQDSLTQWLRKVGFKNIKIDLDSSDVDFPQFETLIATAEKK